MRTLPRAVTVAQAFPAEAAHVIADARCLVLVTEKSFLDRALQLRASGTTRLETIVCLDGGNETTLSWQELIECEQEEFDLGAAQLR